MSKILVGSKYFFSCYEDFEPNDEDYVLFSKNPKTSQQELICNHLKIVTKNNNICLFLFRYEENPMNYIDFLCHKTYFGLLLVPEIANLLNFSINELKSCNQIAQNLDDRYQYYQIIYNAYIENDCFILTPEQRFAAYQSYKNSRQ